MIGRIIYVPIEPLEERYSASWYKNIPAFFRGAGYDVDVVDGEALTTKVETGTFLDINSTVYYKCSQLQKIANWFRLKQIKDGDVFFFGDVEFWGIESIRLMAQMNKVNIKMVGFLHAASYTKEDAFEVAAPYQKYTELGWLSALDKVFVGSEYHKQAIIDRRLADRDKIDSWNMEYKIVVTGNPLFAEGYDPAQFELGATKGRPWFPIKKKQLILPNRFDWEKRPNVSLDFAYILKRRHPDLEIVVTTGRDSLNSNRHWLDELAYKMEDDGIIRIEEGIRKERYHRLLAESKIMLTNTIEENFGYCVVEACLFDTWPILENKYSHPELVDNDRRLLFDSEDEILEKVELILADKYTGSPYQYGAKYYDSMQRILTEIQVL